jgi:predicted PurR-regulated permease PerM
METISFVLGIVFVVVIGISVVATYAFFKVINVQKSIDEIDRRFANVYQIIGNDNRQINTRVDNLEREVFSQLDSRLDKLENKLTTKN